ncbi:hypothetical protein, partial sequence, partial [Candidatus Phytoplasma solani]
IKKTFYQSDGKTIDFINEYDKHSGELVNKTQHQFDGTTIKSIIKYSQYDDKLKEVEKIDYDYNKDNGKLIKETYNNDYINEYDKDTGKLVKETNYQPDRENLWYIHEYDKKTYKLVKKTNYRKYSFFSSDFSSKHNGTIKSIIEFNKDTGEIV